MTHQHTHAPVPAGPAQRRRLVWTMVVIGTVFVAQVIGGLLTGSLALLADAGHMISDFFGLGIALVASFIAARPATDRNTFGFYRVEVFAAMFNGLILLVVAGTVTYEAIGRFRAEHAPEISGTPMLVVAVIGLIANIIGMLLLREGAKENINMRGAYLEVFGDAVGSIMVIAAAVVILATGFTGADALASLGIAVLIVPRAILLLRDVFRVLLQSAPRETNVTEIREHLLRAQGVVAVHDVHVWAITTGKYVFSAHVVVADSVLLPDGGAAVLEELGTCLSEHFDVDHSTFQLEPASSSPHGSAPAPGDGCIADSPPAG